MPSKQGSQGPLPVVAPETSKASKGDRPSFALEAWLKKKASHDPYFAGKPQGTFEEKHQKVDLMGRVASGEHRRSNGS